MFILDFLWSLWHSFYQILTFSRNTDNNKLSVHVKSNTGDSVEVDLDPDWNIGTLKENIAPKLGLPADDLEIILAGKSLDNSTTIAECDIGEQSILHAVKSHGFLQRSKPLNQIMGELTEESNTGEATDTPSAPVYPTTSTPAYHATNEADDRNGDHEVETTPPRNPAHFYVYCSHCTNAPGAVGLTSRQRLKEGKLRVRCSSCKSGAITLDRDPASWSDVLEPNRISGDCQELGCKDGPVAWAEFFFKCTAHVAKADGEEAVPLCLIRSNTRNAPCLACMDALETVVVFGCSHSICFDCFIDYTVSKIRERKFVLDDTYGYSLLCPIGCDGSLITEIHHFRLLPPNFYNMYQQFAAEDLVLKTGGVLCPRPDCGMGIYPDNDCSTVRCTCGYVFCKRCLQGNHLGDCYPAEDVVAGQSQPYSVDPSRAEESKWNEASRRSIRASTKPCPKCRTATEIAGGCMHMVCTRCDFEWCWVCQTAWTRNCMGSHWFG